MPKAISDIKESVNQLNRAAKLGRVDYKTLAASLNDVVNFLAAKETGTLPISTIAEFLPTLAASPATTTSAPAPTTLTAPSTADVVAPKRGRRKRVTVGDSNPAVPAVTVGTPVPDPVAKKEPSGTTTKTLPLRVKVGKGITVGTQGTVNTGVTVGSAPANPAGQVTVGGRPRQ